MRECCLLADHHEYLGFVWEPMGIDKIAHVIWSSIESPHTEGQHLALVPCYKKDHGNLQGIFEIPSGHYQRDAEATRWAGNIVFTYAQMKVSIYLSLSTIYLVFHSTLRSCSEEENSLGVFCFSICNKSMLSWDAMYSMWKEKTDIVHCDCMSASVSSCKITYAGAVLIGWPWQCCPSSSMSNQRPRFPENFQSGTSPCAYLSVLICDISINWTFFVLIVGDSLFNKTTDLVENRTSTSSYPPETESSDWFYSALMISDLSCASWSVEMELCPLTLWFAICQGETIESYHALVASFTNDGKETD